MSKFTTVEEARKAAVDAATEIKSLAAADEPDTARIVELREAAKAAAEYVGADKLIASLDETADKGIDYTAVAAAFAAAGTGEVAAKSFGEVAAEGLTAHKSGSTTVEVSTKDVHAGGSSAGAFLFPGRGRGDEAGVRTPKRVLDLVPAYGVQSPSIEAVIEKTFTNAAAPKADYNAGFVEAPKSNLTYSKLVVSAKTVAHWFAVGKNLLSDEPALAGRINSRGLDGLATVVDTQLVAGDGTGENLTGILNTAGVQTLAFTTGDTRTATVRKAITLTEDTDQPADAVLLNPADWEAIELGLDGDTHAHTQGRASRTLWGLPVVTSSIVPAGKAIIGAFAAASERIVREDASVTVADQHANFAVAGAVAMIFELRTGFYLIRPSSFVVANIVAPTV